MSRSHVDDLQHRCDRAAEMRVISTTMKSAEVQAMTRLADDYDALADRAEVRAGNTEPPIARLQYGPEVMHKVLLTTILLVGSVASAGALDLQEFAPSIGGMRIVAPARDDGRYASSPLKSWFDRLASGKGLCCSFADGFRIDNVDWDTQDGHYRVRLHDEWIVVPDSAVVTEPNKLGPAVVWPYMDTDGQTQIRCFLPGAGA